MPAIGPQTPTAVEALLRTSSRRQSTEPTYGSDTALFDERNERPLLNALVAIVVHDQVRATVTDPGCLADGESGVPDLIAGPILKPMPVHACQLLFEDVAAEYLGVQAGHLARIEARGDDDVLTCGALSFQLPIQEDVVGLRLELGVLGNRYPDEYLPVLADAVSPVGALVLDSGIPPAVEVHHVVRRVQG